MSKFKVGNKVKANELSNGKYSCTNLKNHCEGVVIKTLGKTFELKVTKHDSASEIGQVFTVLYDYFELVEEPIKTTELKIDSNRISSITQKDDTIDAFAYAIGGLKKELEMKEGNKMIESMNLIDLYASKHKENIERETKKKIEELRKNCDVINKYNELVEQFKKDCDELYLSQFTEEEKEVALAETKEIDDINKQLQRKFGTLYRYEPNKEFTTEEMTEIMEKMAQKKCEINDLVKTVKAHVGIAKTKEEVEEILTRYGIIDKKGKLVTE